MYIMHLCKTQNTGKMNYWLIFSNGLEHFRSLTSKVREEENSTD